MIRDLGDHLAVIQSGYWRVQVDLERPHLMNLCADPGGHGDYCREVLEPLCGAGSRLETVADGILDSRDSRDHKVRTEDGRRLHVGNIRMGAVARMGWSVELCGHEMNTLRITVRREILRETMAITDLLFGVHAVREFAFWSQPSLRFNHDPVNEKHVEYCPYEERRRRRVIGYHSAEDIPEFVIHGSPSYPDFVQRILSGFHQLEQHYTQCATFGLSSLDFSSGPHRLPVGEQCWTIELQPVPQGILAPVAFDSGNARMDSFVPAFFDGFLLSAIACDHTFFGNNPYRHAYAPGALDHLARGYLVTDRSAWSERQGNMEKRWRTHIRRTLREGVRPDGRLMILLDSGVWQDACGTARGQHGAWSLEAQFVNACGIHLLKSGDQSFAAELYDDVKRRTGVLAELDTDGDGLLENPVPGTPGSPASCYNDNLCIGHKDGYLNAAAHEVFVRVASLAEWLDRAPDAADLRKRASLLAAAYNDQLWDDAAGRYCGWIDNQGTRHDAWYTMVNFLAVTSGLVPPNRTRRLMHSFLSHPNHHLIFAAGLNLDPIPEGDISHSCASFGMWLNGGVLLGPAAHELYARAVGVGAECAWDMLDDVVAQWEKDRLCGTPLFDPCRSGTWSGRLPPRLRYTGKNAFTWIDGIGATGAGTEPYLADGGALLWALYEGVFGLRADFKKLRLEPHVPVALRDAQFAVRLMGRRIEVRCHGCGDRLETLCLDEADRGRRNQLMWDELREGSVLDLWITSQP